MQYSFIILSGLIAAVSAQSAVTIISTVTAPCDCTASPSATGISPINSADAVSSITQEITQTATVGITATNTISIPVGTAVVSGSAPAYNTSSNGTAPSYSASAPSATQFEGAAAGRAGVGMGLLAGVVAVGAFLL
ncbi:hypothetical protein EDC01DRAFT_778337 [Geopyxis carbonaria]|nr:hypothetical protein EDC01DRAFT_778337 [Geopyxis carbonaria]